MMFTLDVMIELPNIGQKSGEYYKLHMGDK